MDKSNVRIFLFLIGFILLVSLACSVALTDPTAVPATATSAPPEPTKPVESQATKPSVRPTLPPPPPVQGNSNGNSNGNGGGSSDEWTLFTDQNNLYQIQVPGDWVYAQTSDVDYYIDQFKSPDEQALVENITFNNGQPFYGSSHGAFALDLLNRFYSNTGAVGDIRVTGDQIQPDGSERLEWTSKSGGYSGYSYFEIRGDDRTTFLMITIEWMDSAQDQYLDILSQIIESYTFP